MQSIIKELYYGNICPNRNIHGQDSPFVKAARIKVDCMKQLKEKLDHSEYELFEKYCEANSEIEGIMSINTFDYALRFGILLMIEIFSDENKMSMKGIKITIESEGQEKCMKP